MKTENYLTNLFRLLIVFSIGLLLSNQLLAQDKTISGKIISQEDKEPLVGVAVIIKGTKTGTTTDINGSFTLKLPQGATTLVVSYIGFETQEIPIANQRNFSINLIPDAMQLQEFVLVGSRNENRTITDSPVPVDVIDINEVTSKSGQVEINDLLQYAAPSFNASKQSGSDGADHIVPATLRGLGPDQSLVLINGKRRHASSLINIFGTRGRGNSGTDLNAIPVSAIERIEILRDGASAQYGSDAIAGVINIVLKKNVGELTGSVTFGSFSNNPDGDFEANAPNTDGNRLDVGNDGNQIGDDKSFDGNSVKVATNYGVALGKKGYANFTTEYISRDKTLRPGFDFRRGFGIAGIEGFNMFVNGGISMDDKSEFYFFGGRNHKETDAFAFTRNNPTARNVVSIYPNGFTPRITSLITDNSYAVGFRTESKSGIKIDISNTFGVNNFHYFIKGTLNASLQESSPTDFDAGGHRLSQNVTNLDFSKFFKDALNGVNLAFGMEYRTENFEIFAGEPGSYGTFDVNGVLVTDPSQTIPTDPVTGESRPGGSQGFPGYSPANEVDRNRSNFALYLDSEFDFSDAFMISTAIRFENYSDFGSTLNYKLASRYKISDAFTLRGSLSSGFRAPSLAQIYYNLRFTDFQGGVASETLLSPNNSPVTKAFGIEALKQETAVNMSLGFALNLGDFTATIDGYSINVDDRIVLTGTFDASSLGINVAEAQFFANGVDTKTTGVDIVLTWNKKIGNNQFNASLTGNINNMEIKNVNNGALDKETFFGAREEAFLLASAPESKFGLNLGFSTGAFSINLNETYFSEITLIDFADTEDVYEARVVTNLNMGYDFNKNMRLSLGANNLFNVYPSIQTDGETEAGGYWDSVQMGFNGAYYYGRLNFSF